jgi:tetratricopeptide (TPR) repeat protein
MPDFRTRLLDSMVALGAALQGAAQQPARPLTFADDVAPIVHARCAGCHSPGQAGPFALLEFEDVAKRAKGIADVVARRLMPPWLPDADHGGPFVGERRLADGERATLLAWIEQGCAPGDLARLPAAARAASGWQLGEPDLVLALEPACAVPLEGRDVYRNFVVPVPLAEARFVRALEFDPGNRALLHHASIGIDSTGSARALDARDAEPGFPGMGMGGARLPDGHFLGWAPGKSADPGREDLAWRIAPGDELVLQMHLRPSGKPGTVRPRIGLHFAARAPAHSAVAVVLSALDIDIPAGASEYVVTREYALPVAASVLALYPHAHYLGKELRAWAELSGEGERPLLRIELLRIGQWDFDWQDSYRFVEPVELPAGAKLCMRYTYDNSAANPLNPSSPPRRVVYGESSSDEMGELLVQLLPARAEERERLERDFARHLERETLAHLETLLRAAPLDARLRYSIGLAHERLEEWPAAMEHLRAVVEQRPRDALARAVLGRVLARAGELESAEQELARARADLGPDPRTRQVVAGALVLLGEAHRARGDEPRAASCFTRAAELAPDDRDSRARLERR